MSDWESNLKSKYPLTLNHLSYFECNDGWQYLLDDLCFVIEQHLKFKKLEDVYAVQVKEKFGSLRFYMSYPDDFIEGAIALAEKQSGKTCEICGKSGTIENLGGWLKSLCSEHLQEMKAKRDASRMK